MSSLGRIFPFTIAFVIALLLLAGDTRPVNAVTLTVTKTADTADGECNADCSLREAVIRANQVPGLETINVPAGTYTLALAGVGENASALGDIDITQDVVMNGAGAGATIIDGGMIDRVVQVIGGAVNVTISGVTIQHGSVSGDPGGGVRNRGNLTINNSEVKDNTVSGHTAGGISNCCDNLPDLYINNSTISGNTTSHSGGGIHMNGGTLTINNSTISGNTASGAGGIHSGTATITNSTIVNNSTTAGSTGGGLVGIASNATATLKNSILANNTASGIGSECGGAPILSQGYNLIENTSGCTVNGDTTGNITGIDPELGSLDLNGPGETYTHAPLPASPVIDAGSPATPGSGGSSCKVKDQRLLNRPTDGGGGAPRCDIGAVEICPVAPDGDGDSIGDGCDNCPATSNALQQDDDGDNAGNACEAAGSGNVDCGAGVNSIDSLFVLRSNVSLPVPQEEPCLNIGLELAWGGFMGDVDCSGGVNSIDAIFILRANAGLSVNIPDGCPAVRVP